MQPQNPLEMNNLKDRLVLVEEIYQKALAQHPEFKQIKKEELCSVIGSALDEVKKLENAANLQSAAASISRELAKNIVAVWDFSGPGVYDGPDRDDDRYKDISWARGMEHARLSYTAFLVRKITEILNGEVDIRGPISNVEERKQDIKKLISDSGPMVIYNGTLKENQRVEDVLERKGIIIPKEKMLVINNAHTNNTNDQIKTMLWPKELHQSGKEVVLVSSAPHLMRIAHVLQQYKTIPQDMSIRLFPVATPKEGKDEYAAMEILGLLYYSYLAKEKSAAVEAYPYKINGED